MAGRQAVTIGRNGTQTGGAHFKQHTVEVVADVLLGHGEAGTVDHTTQAALLQGERLFAGNVIHIGEFGGRQRRQSKAGTAGADINALLVLFDFNLCTVR